MEVNTESLLLQNSLIGPAFLVTNGIITGINNAAAQRTLTVGTAVEDLIVTGSQEYRQFRSGKLYLQLMLGGVQCGAYVTVMDGKHLFCLDSAYQNPELRTLALAAQQLRNPLNEAMINTDLLQANHAIREDPEVNEQLAALNRSLYQMIRAVCNMSDASGAYIQTANQELRDAAAVFDEILAKAEAVVSHAERKLVFKGLSKSVSCLMDADLLERAVLNILSNAVKFSPKGSTIQASLRLSGKRLLFSMENDGLSGASPFMHNAFAHFLREPGLENPLSGIGLGMSIVRCAAAAHGGTVLFDTIRKNGAKVVMTVATDRAAPPMLESPLRLVGGYTGGFDKILVELSEVLPDSLYEGF